MNDHIVIRILTRIWDLILLNVLWLICSIPIVTIGAATTALYSVTLRMVSNEEGHISKDFFKAIKKNLKQSTIVWLILLLLGVILYLDIRFLEKCGGSIALIGRIVFGVIGLIYVFEVLFVFPLIARYENKTVDQMKNAVFLPLARLPKAFCVLVLTVVCIIATLFTSTSLLMGGLIWMTFGVALVALANSYIFRDMFRVFETP